MQDINKPPIKQTREIIVIMSAAAAFFMTTLDTSIVNLALPEISQEFRSNLATLQWIVDFYVLSLASLLILAGSLGDVFGAKRIFLLGLTIFTLSSGLCCFAPDVLTLEAARILQGAGAALQLPTSLTLLTNIIPTQDRRVRAVSLWAGAGPLGLAFGPVAGGLLVQAYGWRSVFAVNLPVGAIVAAFAWAIVPDSQRLRTQRIDFPGLVSLLAMLGSLTFLLIEVPRHGWTSGAFPFAAVLIAAVPMLIIAEMRTSSPMLPLKLFRNIQFSSTTLIGLLHNIGIFGQIFVLGLSLQELLGQTPLRAGLLFLPLTGALALGTRVSARALAAIDAITVMILGHLLAAIGAVGIALVGFGMGQAGLLSSMIVMGLGAGITTPAMNISILDAAPRDRSGVASGVLNTARQIGTLTGVALLGACLSVPLQGADVRLACLLGAFALAAAGFVGIWSRWSASASAYKP